MYSSQSLLGPRDVQFKTCAIVFYIAYTVIYKYICGYFIREYKFMLGDQSWFIGTALS